MDKLHHKIMMVSFVGFAFVLAAIVRTMLEVLASSIGSFAVIYDQDLVRHGVPAASGIALFVYMVASAKTRVWAQEVIAEVAKVVWPSKKDTTAMTIVVTIIILVSGFMLGAFDFFSKNLISLIIDFKL